MDDNCGNKNRGVFTAGNIHICYELNKVCV